MMRLINSIIKIFEFIDIYILIGSKKDMVIIFIRWIKSLRRSILFFNSCVFFKI